MVKSSEANTFYCSFCGKSHHEVKRLIEGPSVFICNECVLICVDALVDRSSSILKMYDNLVLDTETADAR